jgi:hypothetical protein
MLLVFVFFTYKCKVFNKNVKILARERERKCMREKKPGLFLQLSILA